MDPEPAGEIGRSSLSSTDRRSIATYEPGWVFATDFISEAAASTSADGQPDWARRMKHAQTIRHGASAAGHAVRSGDHGGSGSSVDLSEGGR